MGEMVRTEAMERFGEAHAGAIAALGEGRVHTASGPVQHVEGPSGLEIMRAAGRFAEAHKLDETGDGVFRGLSAVRIVEIITMWEGHGRPS